MLGGGIVKHEQDKMKGGFVVYLYVNSIEETLTVRSVPFALCCHPHSSAYELLGVGCDISAI